MCGITGMIGISSREPRDMERLRKMTGAILHRGPDGGGEFISRDKKVAFGHRRLSIIDPVEASNQPMRRDDLGLVITFNGEIYNYIELRDELRSLGFKFSTNSDTEVILCAYSKWGIECVKKFNGMWAFALYDEKNGRVFISRDRFGVKPLYFIFNDGTFYFSSEIKAFSKIFRLRPDLTHLYIFMQNGRIPDRGSTFFKGVTAFPQATYMEIDLASMSYRFSLYWEYEYEKALKEYDFTDKTAAFRQLLESSIKLRMRSDVPIGTCLSGGLDSSSIVSVISKKFGIKVSSFSAVYDESDCDEKSYIDAVSLDCATDPHVIKPSGAMIPEAIEKISYHQDEPAYGPGIFSQWFVMQLAHPHVKVLLNGQGADEILGGYTYFYSDYLIQIIKDAGFQAFFDLKKLASTVSELIGMRRMLPLKYLIGGVLLKVRALKKMYRRITDRDIIFTRDFERSAGRMPDFGGGERFNVSGTAFLEDIERSYKKSFSSAGDLFSAENFYALTTSSLPALLRYEDRNSMAFSIESRTPFLDYRLVEYCLTLPYRDKIDGNGTKKILRRAMEGTLCREVMERRNKMGYPTPFYNWIRNEARDYVTDILLSDRAKKRNIINFEYSKKVLNDHINNGNDRSWEIWRVLSVENWFRNFIDRA